MAFLSFTLSTLIHFKCFEFFIVFVSFAWLLIFQCWILAFKCNNQLKISHFKSSGWLKISSDKLVDLFDSIIQVFSNHSSKKRAKLSKELDLFLSFNFLDHRAVVSISSMLVWTLLWRFHIHFERLHTDAIEPRQNSEIAYAVSNFFHSFEK